LCRDPGRDHLPRWGDDEFFNTLRRAVITGSVITGSVIGLIGAGAWEVIEIVLDLVGFPISHTLPDTIFDVVLGIMGGASGAWAADRYLDRLFGRSRTDAHRPRVR
jgi:hypothetical protein